MIHLVGVVADTRESWLAHVIQVAPRCLLEMLFVAHPVPGHAAHIVNAPVVPREVVRLVVGNVPLFSRPRHDLLGDDADDEYGPDVLTRGVFQSCRAIRTPGVFVSHDHERAHNGVFQPH